MICFAVKRGNLPKERLDPVYTRYKSRSRFAYASKRLGELVSREPDYGASARAVPRTNPDEPRYIRITDYGDDGITLPHEFVTADSWKKRHRLKPDDLLFARSGATVGKTYLHRAEFDPAVFAGYCIRFRFGQGVLPEFVYGYTKTNAYASWVGAIQRPAGQPNINKEEFKSLQVPVPPPPIQHQLVHELDAARSERDSALAKADCLLSGMNDIVTETLGLPTVPQSPADGYAIRLGTARAGSTLSADYFHPERMRALKAIRAIPHAALAYLVSFERETVATPGSSRYIGLASVAGNTGQLTDAQENATGQCFKFGKDDVLYGRLRPYLNKVWLSTFDGVCSTEFHVLRVLGDGSLLPAYLAVVMRTQLIVAQTKHMMTGNTHPRLANEDVVNLLIPLADPTVQQRIVDKVEASQREALRLRAHAHAVWQRARDHFEAQLLQGDTP